jgi:hypothetical protein
MWLRMSEGKRGAAITSLTISSVAVTPGLTKGDNIQSARGPQAAPWLPSRPARGLSGPRGSAHGSMGQRSGCRLPPRPGHRHPCARGLDYQRADIPEYLAQQGVRVSGTARRGRAGGVDPRDQHAIGLAAADGPHEPGSAPAWRTEPDPPSRARRAAPPPHAVAYRHSGSSSGLKRGSPSSPACESQASCATIRSSCDKQMLW